MLAWESLAERAQKWDAFMADPEWISKRAESEKDGPIVANIANTILQPTAFSATEITELQAAPRSRSHRSCGCAISTRAAELYRKLGFTVGARNRHPWGTHNHIVQLPGFFIELLTLAEPDKLAATASRRCLAPSTATSSPAARACRCWFWNRTTPPPMKPRFEPPASPPPRRCASTAKARQPDGTPVKVAFSLAFADDAQAPDASFFTCQQHYPENFWNPAFQQHGNGVEWHRRRRVGRGTARAASRFPAGLYRRCDSA